jgi:hypothetical protein
MAATAYGLVVRPWMLSWGSTDEERTRPLPGDDLSADADYVTTRAATIQASARSVWPWLIQMGQDRAGFYTHNWVERLLQSGIPDTSEIRPEWQHIEVGDLMRTNRDIGGKPMGWPVVAVESDRSLVVSSKSMPAGTYAFVLEPLDGSATRLIVRDRARWKWWEWPFARLLYEPLHAYMETGLIRGVRQRSEAVGAPSLMDAFLPQHDVTEVSATTVPSTPAAVWAAIHTADLNRSPTTRVLLRLRAIPDTLRRAATGGRPPDGRLALVAAPRLTLADLPRLRSDFMTLGETPGRELVLGLVLPIWPTRRAADVNPSTFAAFDAPGYAKVGFNISMEEVGDRWVRLRTETRVSATSAGARRAFRVYWLGIGPFSAYLRRVMLRTIAAEARKVRTQPPAAGGLAVAAASVATHR